MIGLAIGAAALAGAIVVVLILVAIVHSGDEW